MYVASRPLGEIVRVLRPPQPLSELVVGPSFVVGLTRDRQVLASNDGGETWSQAEPTTLTPFALAVDSEGHVGALSAPEQRWLSEDGGRTFRELALSPVGAIALDADPAGRLSVLSVAKGRIPFGISVAKAPSEPFATSIKNPPTPDPSEADIADGHVMLDGSTWVLFRPSGRRWQAWEGTLGGPFKGPQATPFDDCQRLRVTAAGRVGFAFCWPRYQKDQALPIQTYVTRAKGKDWSRIDLSMLGIAEQFRARTPDGNVLLLSGVCPSAASGMAVDCKPHGLWHARLKGVGVGQVLGLSSLAPSVLPSMVESPLALSVAADGRRVAAVGLRSKSQRLELYWSEDAGLTFLPHPLYTSPAVTSQPHSLTGLGVSPRDQRSVDALDVAEDGSVSVILRDTDHPQLWRFEPDGELLSVSEPPPATSRLGVRGHRLLAISITERRAYESQDGGASYDPISVPAGPLCRSGDPCHLACTDAGCLLGRSFARLGWGKSRQDTVSMPLLPRTAKVEEPGWPWPGAYACRTDGVPWQTLADVSAPPDTSALGLGQQAFFSVGVDRKRSSVTLYHAFRGEPQLRARPLFDEVPEPEKYGISVARQVEGGAAVRAPIQGSDAGGVLRTELASANLMRGSFTSKAVQLPWEQGAKSQSSARPVANGLRLGLLTTLGAGVAIHTGPRVKPGDSLYVVEPGSATVRRLVLPVPPRGPLADSFSSAHVDVLLVHGQPLPIVLYRDQVILRVDPTGYQGFTLAPPPLEPFSTRHRVTLSYRGSEPGLLVTQWSEQKELLHSGFFTLRSQGAVTEPELPAATLRNLSSPERVCSARQRGESPRVVVDHDQARRWGLMVVDGAQAPRWVWLRGLVLYGTETEPCLDALRADDESQDSLWSVALLPESPERAWLFRVIAEDPERTNVQVRPLSCRFEAGLRPPTPGSNALDQEEPQLGGSHP